MLRGKVQELTQTFYFFYKCIYFCLGWVFIAVHGLSLVLREWGLLLVAVCELLIAVVSLVAEHGL